ncbi:class I SAM-dependent methyltransferase [Nocardiopsis deserti]|uniref:hypothetical protein n=1 Tax=Nocardiopsis deserti TaxID=2605988 RepID=UPI00123A2783|nr:hypothetical protein [Nocardiopsis deserti]
MRASTTTGTRQVAHLDLWLATHDTHFGRLSVTPRARENGIDPTPRWAGACLHDGRGRLAYLVLRELDNTTTKTEEIGVVAHGPDASAVAAHLTALLQRWAQTMPAHPTVTAHPTTTSPEELPAGVRVVKPDTSFTISW